MKLPGAQFEIGLSLEPRTVVLTIIGLDGERHLVPINPDTAEELGKELLAGALALNGKLELSGAHDRLTK